MVMRNLVAMRFRPIHGDDTAIMMMVMIIVEVMSDADEWEDTQDIGCCNERHQGQTTDHRNGVISHAHHKQKGGQ